MRWSRQQDFVKTAVRQCPGCRTDRKMRRKKYLPRAGAARQPDVSRAILHSGVRKEMQMPRRQEQAIVYSGVRKEMQMPRRQERAIVRSGVRRRGHPPRVTRRLHRRELPGVTTASAGRTIHSEYRARQCLFATAANRSITGRVAAYQSAAVCTDQYGEPVGSGRG